MFEMSEINEVVQTSAMMMHQNGHVTKRRREIQNVIGKHLQPAGYLPICLVKKKKKKTRNSFK